MTQPNSVRYAFLSDLDALATGGLVTSMAAGYWSVPVHGSRGTMTLNEGRMFVVPFFPDPKGPLIDALAVEVTTAVAATTIYLGVYSRDNHTGTTFTLQQSFGSVAADTVGRKDAVFTAGFDHKPHPRLLLAAVASGGSPGVRGHNISGMVSVPTNAPEGTSSGHSWRFELGAGATALPATLSAPNMDYPNSTAPLIFYRSKA